MIRKIKPVLHLEQLEPRLLLNAVPYIQDFSLGKPDAAAGWDYYSDNEGRIEVVSGRLQMDDTAGNSIYSSNEAILHVDLTGKTGVTLTLDHWNLADENDALPDSFAGHSNGDGIALSVDGQNWVKVTDLNVDFTNESFKLDSVLQQALAAATSVDVSDVQIKFQQYDNYPASTDGRQFDNIKIQATTVVAQAVPYSQDFTLGKPDAVRGWEYYSDSEGRIRVVSGRLRMDAITDDTYSLNEAILHVNLTGKTGVTLTLDHLSLNDEIDSIIPNSFIGHYKGDGIALSINGQDWVKVTDLTVNFTNQTFNLDTLLQQAKIAAGSTDVSNVRIKFQQYDNYSANTDGREFDNIVVNFSTNQAPVISSVTASPSTISDTQTSQLQVVSYDPDSGPNPLAYSWSLPTGTGSLNNPNIVNPIYTPPDVSATQTFTLTVKVSDGTDITSKTVNITVTDTIPVNQAPVISSVTASPSTISDTQTSQLQVVSYDPDSGPNPLTYTWSVPTGAGSLNNPNIVNPIYTPPDVSATQTFTLTVNVSDGAAITSKTVNITVTDAGAGPQILLSEDFNDGNYNGWSLVDQGNLAGPMAWSAASGVMVQSSNVHTTTVDGVARLGTYAYWQAGTGWTDYTAAATIKSND
ncbi:MAG: LEPR-XLL domain-containing protein, partial [Phycisphaerae bacterium]|nr:LEPR-XLL domain-containing protein [Phycisphaerae bacterium]